jgi:acyl dehydratase
VTSDVSIGTLVRSALPAIPVVNLLPGIRKSGASELTGLDRHRPPLEIRREHVAAYARVCGFPDKDTVPVTYPHILGFGLQLDVMADPAFPFPAIGSVHLANTITTHRPIAIGETVEVSVRAEHLKPHAKGRSVEFVSEVTSQGELVWEGRSTYLRFGKGSPEAPAGPVFDDVEPSGATWRLDGDIGRRYAAVSGDRNPIHLYPLTARAFGFKRQIAHGMWSAARCLAAIENRLPDAATIDVLFRKPVFLPGTVAFGCRQTDTGHVFSMTSPTSGTPHVQGRVVRG